MLALLVYRIGAVFEINDLSLRLIHGFMNLIAVLLGLTPFFTIINGFFKPKNGYHLYSIHCWIGIITIFFLIIQSLIAIVYYIITSKSKKMTNKFETIHKNNGYAICSLICLSALLGIGDKNYRFM